MAGKVYLVGAGPWDPGLLTLRGRRLLETADTIVYDYLVNPALLEHVSAHARIVPTGRTPDRLTQSEICSLLIKSAEAGDQVVRLKGGDPFVFGRGGEEAEALVDAKIPFEVVPGVTAAVASAAYAGIPVTHRAFGSTLGFCTGHLRDDGSNDELNWSALASMSAVVFYMSAKRLVQVRDGLLGAGRGPDTPVAIIRWATRPDQKTVVTALDSMVQAAEDADMGPPLTVIIGDIVGLRQQIQWYEQRPLFGRRIVVTRSQRQQQDFCLQLHELGADVLAYPTIAFEAVNIGHDKVIEEFDTFDWVLFTSANGVDFFLDSLASKNLDNRIFGTTRIACIGPVTARRLLARGLRADLVPDRYVAEALIESLLAIGIDGQKILIPRAERAREILPDALGARARVQVLPVYRTVPGEVDPQVHDRVARGEVDVVTFTASSTVEHFVSSFSAEELAAIQKHAVAACIGPITAETARMAGFRVDVVAQAYTIRGLTDALSAWGTGAAN